MDPEEELEDGIVPDEELSKKLEELVMSDDISWSCIKDLAKYLRNQPPRSEDAVEVGNLFLKIRKNVWGKIADKYDSMSEQEQERLENQYKDLREEYNCDCPLCVHGISVWWELAIQLDPKNPEPYKRLAREIWWEENQWPGTVLEPLSRSSDELTLRRVMKQYQKDLGNITDMIFAEE